MFFHSVNYTRAQKTNDSVIETVSGKIIEIHYFLSSGNECYICGRVWVIGDNGFHKENGPPIAYHISKVLKKRSKYIFCEITKIKQKAIVIDTQEQVYLTFIPNNYEIQ